MIRKKTVHQHLLDLGFSFVANVHRHRFYSRNEDNDCVIQISVYRTTLFMTHIYITTRNSAGEKVHCRFARLTDKTTLNVIDKAISAEESLIA